VQDRLLGSGAAISAEANRIDDARGLNPLVGITSPDGGGLGIGVEDEGKYFSKFNQMRGNL
jgi:hypothetical protein